jgi:hypothetical protein
MRTGKAFHIQIYTSSHIIHAQLMYGRLGSDGSDGSLQPMKNKGITNMNFKYLHITQFN